MSDTRKAHPGARRQAILLVAAAVLAGVLLFFAIERYRAPLRDWVLADPAVPAERLGLIVMLLAVLLLAPLLGFAAYLWSLGGRTLRSRAFPPPEVRVFRDTRVVTGEAAVSRGRLLRLVAAGCGVAAVAMGILLWRLVMLLGERAT